MAILNVMFTTFGARAGRRVACLLIEHCLIADTLTSKHGVYKVETIGDAYLACTGVVTRKKGHDFDLGLLISRCFSLLKIASLPKRSAMRAGFPGVDALLPHARQPAAADSRTHWLPLGTRHRGRRRLENATVRFIDCVMESLSCDVCTDTTCSVRR